MSTRLAPITAHWLRNIDTTLPVTSQYVLSGNLRDRHLVGRPGGDARAFELVELMEAIWRSLEPNGCRVLLRHSPVQGLTCYPSDDGALQVAESILEGGDASLGRSTSYDLMIEVLHRVERSQQGCALVIDHVSQLESRQPPEGLHRLMLASLDMVHRGAVRIREGAREIPLPNPVFWLVDRPADLPSWMVTGGDRIRQVPIPLPDLDTRTLIARYWCRRLPAFSTDAEELVVERFAGSAEGFTARAMQDAVQLARDGGIPAERVDDAVRAHRVGLLENPWKQPLLREKIRDGEQTLTGWVRGQPRAVRHALDVLVRSTLGLGGAFQGKAASGPRGVLFFAGPTGVGKTELAKSITKLLFGHDRAYIRFDMSEFASPHTEARLIGSPPGYTGHGAGGELTNAVRQRPFSVVLFDEIEKADPAILDKFLQILSDGRLTDGSGATVPFTECVIVFTSNLGVAEATHLMAEKPDLDFESAIKAAIQAEFSDPERLNRPELLGRIGIDNIVVFDPLSDSVARELADQFVANVCHRVEDETGTLLKIDPDARKSILDAVVADLDLGGRGVGMAVESLLVNPLSRALIDRAPTTPAVVTNFQVVDGAGVVELT